MMHETCKENGWQCWTGQGREVDRTTRTTSPVSVHLTTEAALSRLNRRGHHQMDLNVLPPVRVTAASAHELAMSAFLHAFKD